MANELKKMVGEKEEIIYKGKPNKKCFIFEGIFNPLFLFVVMCGVVGLIFLNNPGKVNCMDGRFNACAFVGLFVVAMALLYIGNALMAKSRYDNTNYIITDKAVYVSEGGFIVHYKTRTFAEILRFEKRRGMFDKHLGVGDVVAVANKLSTNIQGTGFESRLVINSVSGYEQICEVLNKLVKIAHEGDSYGR